MRHGPLQGHAPYTDCMLLIALWVFALALVNPTGDFPLNDDWSFAHAVKALLDTGEFRPTGWTSMTLLMQTLWGALFCLPAGFSFDALRLSSLVAGAAGIVATYLLTLELRGPRWFAVLAATCCGFSPLYFSLSHTFMTDAPFTALTTFSAVFFVRALRTDSSSSLVAATLLAVAATLTRQLAVALPIAFALSMLLHRGVARRNLMRALAPALCSAGALLAFQHWLAGAGAGRTPALHDRFTAVLLSALGDVGTLRKAAVDGYVALLYVGLFVLPALSAIEWNRVEGGSGRRSGWFAMALGGATVLAATALLWVSPGPSPQSMPVTSRLGIGNVLVPSGIGPLTLAHHNVWGLPAIPGGFWIVVNACALAAGALLVGAVSLHGSRIVSARPERKLGKLEDTEAAAFFLLLTVTVYLLPLLATGFFDRYLIPVLPLVAASLAQLVPRRISVRSALLPSLSMACVLLFSVAATRDYLEWNRTRWRVLGELAQRGIGPERIDGGFEFNGWHLYDPGYRPEPPRSWWWVHDDAYKVTFGPLPFGPLPGYQVRAEYRFPRLLQSTAGRMVVQERISPSRTDEE